jgi:23S rRNA pseudouridine1911/1915/1917 synthase
MNTIVSFDDSGLRCDRYVVLHFPQYSRAQVQRWIETGAITVNGAVVKTATKLRAGDQLTIVPPPVTSSTLIPEDIPLNILYEDGDLIVINKSPNMVVHPGAGQKTGTLVHALLAHCKDLKGVGDEERPGIVHRLDKGTSGVLIVAKSDEVHRALQAQFQSRDVVKEYLACAHGVLRGRSGAWDQAIGRHPVQRKKMAAVPRGRHALTRWECVESFGRFASLLHLFLHTGRTHQIRVHASHAGHPLVGDVTYGGGNVRRGPEAWRMVAHEFARPALHALRLQLTHPRTKELMTWTAPIPEDMAELVLAARRVAEDEE